ncbi:MAG: hypothetical protein ACI4OX_01810 [Akkermansia sp.]
MSSEPQSRPVTALDVCNLALSKLGEPPIAGIDPNGSLAARLCHLHYHPTRREVLCAHRWSFAVRSCRLSAGEEADGLHSVGHPLPVDCLRVLEVNSSCWALRGRCIYCPSSVIRVRYIADEEDTSVWDPPFVEALATLMAARLCIPLTSSTTARKALTEEYHRLALPHAAHTNALQSHSADTHPLALFRSRSAWHERDDDWDEQ